MYKNALFFEVISIALMFFIFLKHIDKYVRQLTY